MAREKGTPYVSSNMQKKADGKAKREREAQVAREAQADQAARDKEAQKARTRREDPILINVKAGRGSGHNCPNKNAGKTHAFSQRCLSKHHAGACRLCKNIASGTDGCGECFQKPDDLQYTNVRFSLG